MCLQQDIHVHRCLSLLRTGGTFAHRAVHVSCHTCQRYVKSRDAAIAGDACSRNGSAKLNGGGRARRWCLQAAELDKERTSLAWCGQPGRFHVVRATRQGCGYQGVALDQAPASYQSTERKHEFDAAWRARTQQAVLPVRTRRDGGCGGNVRLARRQPLSCSPRVPRMRSKILHSARSGTIPRGVLG